MKCLESISMNYLATEQRQKSILGFGYKGWTEIKKHGIICIRQELKDMLNENKQLFEQLEECGIRVH